MDTFSWHRPDIESHIFDPCGDVLLKLTRHCEKEEINEPDSESSSIAGDEEDPDTFPGSDNVSTQEGPTMDLDQNNNDATALDAGYSAVLLNQPVHMRVSSRHLMLASPVFAAMLDRNKFKEGVTLHSEGSVDIELPDDDPDAFIVLLNLVHGHTRMVPRKTTLFILTQIAVLINKYHMLEVAEFFSDMWIRRLSKRGLPDRYDGYRQEVMSWLFISWVFEKPKIFKPMTMVLIQRAPHTLLENDLDFDPPIPDTLLDVIKERRMEAIDSLLSVVDTLTNKYISSEFQCPPVDNTTDPVELAYSLACDSMFLGSLIKASARIGIYPMPDRPFNGIAFDTLAQQVRDMDLKSKCDGNLKGYYMKHACHGVRDHIIESVQALENGIGGLDLKDFKKLGS
ncbi:uncharacterized protein PAC_10433 [Phialocephala subalpina]|uniref:BTB domain-containing protein n=1 Tax=Phialocephala subalpina TaxID=576137 RepID=A0A1L7X694_9HELO|nr:uncharacterized protein PAC_10433 [Phialocephala subalpina]